jgi:SecD/SecF fusion protein
MNKNDRWKFIFVILVVLWSLYQTYPPVSRDLIEQFSSRAQMPDATFTNILQRAEAGHQANTNLSEFAVLRQAIDTNDIQPYFPFISAKTELDPATYILNQLQRDGSGKIKLGLDLQGGTSYLVQMDTNYLNTVPGATNTLLRSQQISGALDQAVGVLRKRVDALGVAEPVIQPQGENQILVQMPGLAQSAKDEALKAITNSAYLEFRMVHDDSDKILGSHEAIPPGYVKMQCLQMEPGQTTPSFYIVKQKAEKGLSGDFVQSARVVQDSLGAPEISFTLNPDGAKRFAEVTTEYAPDPQTGQRHFMAIVLDGVLYSAPYIKQPIVDGTCEIDGNYSAEDAQNLASVLENPLRAPLKVISSSDVDPTLGRDSIRSGIYASIAAVVFVSLFMIMYYRVAGLTANIALITNVIILMGVMCSIGATLTLPGIAGVVLTIGMAVDANVLIYERLREELDKGKSLRGAIAAGYARAFATIFDSHVTTLISSLILIKFGTGEIRGFGVTLTIGVAASLFTALVVTRIIFNFMLDQNWLKSLGMMHIIKSAKVNFMQVATPLFVATWVFAIGAVIFGGTTRGEKLFGVDFLGGDSVTFSFSQKIDVDKLRSAIVPIGEKDAEIQYQKPVSGAETLRVTSSSGSADRVEQALETQFPDAHFMPLQKQQVGAVVGSEIRQSAVVASMFAMFGILIYLAIRYEFSFALGAIVAVFHDVVLTIGCYCIASEVSHRQFNATVVAALLTIIGFSINDKVVIFDRIRENLKLGARGSFREIINQALNQTLSRTIITSGTVFLATLALYIWGGGEINDFAFTFLVGIITGTYSSIYIASVFVLWWHKGQTPNIGASQVTMQNAPAVKA